MIWLLIVLAHSVGVAIGMSLCRCAAMEPPKEKEEDE